MSETQLGESLMSCAPKDLHSLMDRFELDSTTKETIEVECMAAVVDRLKQLATSHDFDAIETALHVYRVHKDADGVKDSYATLEKNRRALVKLAFSTAEASQVIELMSVQHENEFQAEGCAAIATLCDGGKAGQPTAAAKALVEAGGIEATLSALRAHMGDEAVQAEGCRVLWVLGRDVAHQKRITSGDGIAAVIAALRSFPQSARVQKEGCSAVWSLSADETNRVALVAGGGIDVLVAALRAHPSSSEIQAKCCSAMSNLAIDSANKLAIATQGGAAELVAALQRHLSCSALQSAALGALWNLSVEERNRSTIAAAAQGRGVEVLMASLIEHATTEKVQWKGCGLLFNLSIDDDSKAAMVRSDGLTHLKTVQKVHRKSLRVLSFVYGVLWHLSVHETIRKEVAQADGISVIIGGLRSYPGSANVQTTCCGTLWNLALDTDCLREIVDRGGVSCVLAAMRSHSGSEEVQAAGCGALWSLSADAEARSKIKDSGGTQVLLAALQTHQQSRKIQTQALGTIRNFAGDLDCVESMGEPQILEAVVCSIAALLVHEDCTDVQAQGCGALWALSLHDVGLRGMVASAGTLTVLAQALMLHVESVAVQEPCFGALNNVLGSRTDAPALTDVGPALLPAMVASLQRWPKSAHLQQCGCSALSLLTRAPFTSDVGPAVAAQVESVATRALAGFSRHEGVKLAARKLAEACNAASSAAAAPPG